MHTGFSWGNLREGDHLEDPGREGRTILMDLREMGWEGSTDWFEMAEDMDTGRGML